ncbi:hypothetical protein PSPO01_16088 [Paraphaeosphaeria sporulosa]
MVGLAKARTSLSDEITSKFISACHILDYHCVLDAYGHLSVRHTSQPDVFVMARQIAPALISSPEDLIDYRVSDASPIDPSMTDGYVERYIHSEIYKKYPEVNAVIHSHADSVMPYGISGVPLQPCFHMAGFLGTSTPVFDISQSYQSDDIQDMLVRNTRLGKDLADHFADSKEEMGKADHAVVLMRSHGMTVVAPSIEDSRNTRRVPHQWCYTTDKIPKWRRGGSFSSDDALVM